MGIFLKLGNANSSEFCVFAELAISDLIQEVIDKKRPSKIDPSP